MPRRCPYRSLGILGILGIFSIYQGFWATIGVGLPDTTTRPLSESDSESTERTYTDRWGNERVRMRCPGRIGVNIGVNYNRFGPNVVTDSPRSQ